MKGVVFLQYVQICKRNAGQWVQAMKSDETKWTGWGCWHSRPISVAHSLSPEKECRKDRTSFDVWVKAHFVGHRAKKIFRPAFLSYEMADFRSSWIVSQKISRLSRQVLYVVLYERIFLLSGTNHEWTWLIVMCSHQVDGETDGDIRCYWVWCVHARSVRPCVKVLNTI